ncbi:hypothetical protein Tco_1570483 [Tanacetum coccineum]
MSSSTHPIILYDSDIEDAFSLINIPNYASASPNYSLASPGNTFSSTSEHPSETVFLINSSERHGEQIEAILNHLDKLPLRCIEEIEDKIRGLGNDFYSGNDHRGYLSSPPIRYKESSGCDPITMDLLPPGFLEPLYPGFMNVVHNQDIEHMIPPTSPRDTETPIRSPMPLSSSSSPVRSTTPPPDYPFYESIFTELDNLLWIIPRPLGSEPISKEHNESDTMTQAAIRKLIYPMERENDIHEEESNNPPPPQTQIPHTMSHIKLPILKKGEYDIWAMKMEHYLCHIDFSIWEVIQKGNGSIKITTDANGQIKVLPPKTVEEI